MNATTRAILTIASAAAFLGSAHAAEADLGKFDLQKKSTFTLAADRRAPFWPIGWVKRANQGPIEVTKQVPKAKLNENSFALTSIMLGNPSLAVINARAYSEGELIRMPKGSAPMKVRVMEIGDGSVSLSYENQKFTVALKRPELAEHKADEELLSQER